MKLAYGNTVHAQVIGIILCCFTNCYIIYPVGSVYCFHGHPSKTILFGALKFYAEFKMLHMNLLNIVVLLTLKVILRGHPTRTKNNEDYLQI